MFGILNLNKPYGPTSRDCVNRIERRVKPWKVGHAGTLDPLANGVLLILVGQAVRLTDAIHQLPKQYVGDFELGLTSESGDSESETSRLTNAPILEESQLRAVLPSFVGLIEQTPPVFSAIWVDGKRAHELARKGKTVEVPKRSVMVHSLVLTSFDYPRFRLTVSCSTGTYLRALGRDIARSLGSDAVMTHLTRTAIGPFTLEQSVAPETLSDREAIATALQSPTLAVQHLPCATPEEAILVQLEQGKRVLQEKIDASQCLEGRDYAAVIDGEGRLRALIKRLREDYWQADKCFLVEQLRATPSPRLE
jgi:tRNA pseudouridine55 synthase